MSVLFIYIECIFFFMCLVMLARSPLSTCNQDIVQLCSLYSDVIPVKKKKKKKMLNILFFGESHVFFFPTVLTKHVWSHFCESPENLAVPQFQPFTDMSFSISSTL